jgi:hypothetical protein
LLTVLELQANTDLSADAEAGTDINIEKKHSPIVVPRGGPSRADRFPLFVCGENPSVAATATGCSAAQMISPPLFQTTCVSNRTRTLDDTRITLPSRVVLQRSTSGNRAYRTSEAVALSVGGGQPCQQRNRGY